MEATMFPSDRNLKAKAERQKPAAVKSSGCVFCDLNLEPIKLRRQWVHHIPRRGKLIFCHARNLKPLATA